MVWMGGVAGAETATNASVASIIQVGEPGAPIWTVIPASEASGGRISVTFTGFSMVAVEGGYSLQIPDTASSAKPGSPDVPPIAKLIPGVPGYRPALSLRGSDPTNLTGFAVAAAVGYRVNEPEGGARSLKPFRLADPILYAQNQFWPENLGRVEEAWIGTQKVMRVECFPVQYNPVTKTIRFFRRLDGELTFKPLKSAGQ